MTDWQTSLLASFRVPTTVGACVVQTFAPEVRFTLILTRRLLAHRRVRAATTKLCSCGREHSPEDWRLLPRVWKGVAVSNLGDSTLEWRNCTCGSTLVLEV